MSGYTHKRKARTAPVPRRYYGGLRSSRRSFNYSGKGGRRGVYSHAGLSIGDRKYPLSVVYKGPGIMPLQFFSTPKYSYWLTLTDAAGFHDWILRGNSIYDPDFALGGESVSGFDQVMAVYNNYKVLSSAIKIRAVNNDSDDPVEICIFPWCLSTTFAANNANGARARPLAKYIIVSNQTGHGEITHFATTKSMYAMKYTDDPGFQGDSTHNPTHEWFWHVCVYNHTADHALNVQLWLDIDYHTRFSDHYAYTQ